MRVCPGISVDAPHVTTTHVLPPLRLNSQALEFNRKGLEVENHCTCLQQPLLQMDAALTLSWPWHCLQRCVQSPL